VSKIAQEQGAREEEEGEDLWRVGPANFLLFFLFFWREEEEGEDLWRLCPEKVLKSTPYSDSIE
jgi:hypothetical protein